ncbi:hypothetical protein KIW84_030500 [Lathyrus oleraceus]|uniref:Uncharacterized protein n=1 Tax=Pisum sativum TaxID=3888 RepID=A0A9D5AZJ0_PEA|nr:hypothetical protein KIW84_030500 [Pisum sativum]
MVAKTTLTQNNNNMLPVFDPVLIRETLNKVDRCMYRLQELQFTVSGGLNLSPRSTRNYLRTSLRCKQESIRIKNSSQETSPMGKFSKSANLRGMIDLIDLPVSESNSILNCKALDCGAGRGRNLDIAENCV